MAGAQASCVRACSFSCEVAPGGSALINWLAVSESLLATESLFCSLFFGSLVAC
jgi:hypothetical protein